MLGRCSKSLAICFHRIENIVIAVLHIGEIVTRVFDDDLVPPERGLGITVRAQILDTPARHIFDQCRVLVRHHPHPPLAFPFRYPIHFPKV